MVISRFKIITSAIVATAAILAAAPVGAGDPAWGSNKLQGAWIARVIEVPGAQWTYVASSDPSGRRASAHGSIDVGFAGGPEADHTSPLLVEVKMVSPTTAVFNSIWYGIQEGDFGALNAKVVYIGMNHGTIEYTGPDTAYGTHHLEFYLASQDKNNDGLPDPGEKPLPGGPPTVHTLETRLPLYME